jgi:hypothetical protein
MNKNKNILKLLYYDLENIKKNDIYNDLDTINKHIKFEKKLNLVGKFGSYKLPAKNDFISLIYNNYDKPISFNLIVDSKSISFINIKPKEYVYPLYNKSIFPLFMIDPDNYPCIQMNNNSGMKSKHIIDTYIKNISENIHSIYSVDIHNKELNVTDYKNICKKYDIKCSTNKTDMVACIETMLRVDKVDQSQLQPSQIKRNIDIYNYIKSIINDKSILKNKSGSSIIMMSYINPDDFLKIYSAFSDICVKWQKYKSDKINYIQACNESW